MKTMREARVLVTGPDGFLGRHLVAALAFAHKARVFTLSHSADPGSGGDLTVPQHAEMALENCIRDGQLDYVFHLAGFNGGIEMNRRLSADIFYANTLMGLNLLQACASRKVGKVVSVVASCAYGDTHRARDGVLSEEDFLEGQPNPTVAGHGYAKRNLQLVSRFYREQYGLHAICLCPTTLYGPGDSFDPERTKVMGGMIRRFVEARREGLPFVSVWGTGNPLREFLYAPDCAELLIQAALQYDDSTMPLNIGTGQEVSIALLARLVADAAGYKGEIRFDHSKPDGQFRKRLDLTRLQAVLGGLPKFTPLGDGIRQTVQWYEENYK